MDWKFGKGGRGAPGLDAPRSLIFSLSHSPELTGKAFIFVSYYFCLLKRGLCVVS
jgi:hypothetical protein